MGKQTSKQKPVPCGEHYLINRQKTVINFLLDDILNQIPNDIKILSLKNSILFSVRMFYTLL